MAQIKGYKKYNKYILIHIKGVLRMSNLEIITNESMLRNFPFDGENLFTFNEWKQRGYSVQKGQKAFIKTKLWKKTSKKNKDTGETETYFILVTACLFNIQQVEKIEKKTA